MLENYGRCALDYNIVPWAGKTRRHCLVLDRNTLRLQQNAQINTEPLTGWGQGLFLYKIIREKTIDNLYIADTSWINFGSPQENPYDRYSKNNNRSISPFAVGLDPIL